VKRTAPACILALLAAAGCATTDAPHREMTAARAMVAKVRPVAEKEAPFELAAAQGKLARAEMAMQRGHFEHARLLAEQAEADAKLAWTVVEQLRAQRGLRDELERKGQ
jgi:hypothetical protein